MDIVSEETAWREFWGEYRKKPLGWRVHSGISSKGYPEILLTGQQESWLIKRESLFTGKLGLGGRITETYDHKLNTEFFGLREVPTQVLERIVSLTEGSHDPLAASRLMLDLLSQQPMIPRSIKSPVALEGPILHSFRPLHLVSDKQIELDRKLEHELDKWRSRISYIG